jgi:nitrogen regulatory protein PII
MKMLILVYNDVSDEIVTGALKKAHVQRYTKWKEVYGEGEETEPKLGTHIWPGKNNVLAIVAEDDAMPLIRETINITKKEHPKIGLKTFVLQVEETI